MDILINKTREEIAKDYVTENKWNKLSKELSTL